MLTRNFRILRQLETARATARSGLSTANREYPTPGHQRSCDFHLFGPIASHRRRPITKQDHNNLTMKVQRFTYLDHLGKERIEGRLIFRGFQSKRRLVCEGGNLLVAARIICLWEWLPILKKRTHASHPSIFSN